MTRHRGWGHGLGVGICSGLGGLLIAHEKIRSSETGGLGVIRVGAVASGMQVMFRKSTA